MLRIVPVHQSQIYVKDNKYHNSPSFCWKISSKKRIASIFSAIVVSIEYVLITGASKLSNCVGILRFSCLGTITSPTPKSILNGVQVFVIIDCIVTPIPAYFLATAIGAIPFILTAIKSLPVSTDIISSTTAFNCSGVLGTFFYKNLYLQLLYCQILSMNI